MNETRIIRIGCDRCGTSTVVDDIEWFNDIEALCPKCFAVEQAAVEAEQEAETRTQHEGVPVYLFCGENNRVLHVSRDVFSPLRWRDFQGDRWWFLSVTNILVKFFVSEANAKLAVDRLTFALQPLYGDFPASEDPEAPEPTELLEMTGSDKKLDQILHFRVSHDKYVELTCRAAQEGVTRPQFMRSLLYSALMEPDSEAPHER